MIKIENVEVVGWESAIRGMRNPMNSWDKSDSVYGTRYHLYDGSDVFTKDGFCIGNNDLDLMKRLVKAGTDHRKFMRMIVVYVDVTAPLYWWKEADTYKVGTVRNSCSTMHKLTEKEFTLDDFSCEKMHGNTKAVLNRVIEELNDIRERYLNPDKYGLTDNAVKMVWYNLIQLLPSSYNQRATLMLNYEVLANMYHSRKNHRLDEWVEFCKWIETLPYAELIINENV